MRRWIALAALLLAGACHRGAQAGSGQQAAAREAPFVANIRSVRGDVIFAQEETGQHRFAEIRLTPGTEITTRDGAMFIPAANLRPYMRVTVWFTGQQHTSAGTLTGTALRVLVDY